MAKRFWGMALVLLLLQAGIAGACPSRKVLEQSIHSLFGKKHAQANKIRVLKVQHVFSGICEVVLQAEGRNKEVIYTDEKGKFLILGRIIDLQQKKDITAERKVVLNRLSKKELEALKQVVAFSAGEGPVEVFLITDPDCPFCKRAENALLPLIEQKKLKVNVVLFPLPIHPDAHKKAVTLTCNLQDGLKAFKLLGGMEKSFPEKKCEKGEKVIKSTLRLMKKLQINGTPTIVFPDGRIYTGLQGVSEIYKLIESN